MSGNKKVLVFVGMPGSGKSTVVEYLKSKGLPWVYFGNITFEEIKKRGLESTHENERKIREELRQQEGKDVYAKRILFQLHKLFADSKNLVIVESLYSWPEYKAFKEDLGEDAVIIAIVTPRKLRHHRLSLRPDRTMTEEIANSRDYAEIENIDKGGPIANADYYILNTGSVDSLLTDLNNLLTKELGLSI